MLSYDTNHDCNVGNFILICTDEQEIFKFPKIQANDLNVVCYFRIGSDLRDGFTSMKHVTTVYGMSNDDGT